MEFIVRYSVSKSHGANATNEELRLALEDYLFVGEIYPELDDDEESEYSAEYTSVDYVE